MTVPRLIPAHRASLLCLSHLQYSIYAISCQEKLAFSGHDCLLSRYSIASAKCTVFILPDPARHALNEV
jgi:hypothetical protein